MPVTECIFPKKRTALGGALTSRSLEVFMGNLGVITEKSKLNDVIQHVVRYRIAKSLQHVLHTHSTTLITAK